MKTKIVFVNAGGGYRGVISTQFWIALEKELLADPIYKDGARVTKLHEVADLMVGTSTGAIIMGMSAMGTPASVINDLYLDKVKTAFTPNRFYLLTGKPKYDKKPLVELISNTIRHYNGDYIQYAKTPFMCSTVDLCRPRETAFHKSWKVKCQLPMSVALSHSFSAAHYFGATVCRETQAIYADGGEGIANCPIGHAIVQAHKFGWFADHRVYFVVVGTGFSNGTVPFADAVKKVGRVWEIGQYLGLARDQALTSQLYAAELIEQARPQSLDVDYADVQITKDLDVLDGTSFGDRYSNYGKSMAKEYVPIVMRKLKEYLGNGK